MSVTGTEPRAGPLQGALQPPLARDRGQKGGRKHGPFRFGHNIAWRAEYGVNYAPARWSFADRPLTSLSFFGIGEGSLVPGYKLNYKVPMEAVAAVWSANLLGAAPFTHTLVHRLVAPFTKAGVFVGNAESQYGYFGWGWRLASAKGDRIAVSTHPGTEGNCLQADGSCGCSSAGICSCGDAGLCTMAGKRLFPFQSGIVRGSNPGAQSTVCQWASKDAWDASPQAKCIGRKGMATGAVYKGIDADGTWLPFPSSDARLGVRCCGLGDEAGQLEDAQKVCPDTVKSAYNVTLACPGSSPKVSCAQCNELQTVGQVVKQVWACGWAEAGPPGNAEALAGCKATIGDTEVAVVAACSDGVAYVRGNQGLELVDQPLGHLARHKSPASARLDVCAARSCEQGLVPGQICMPGTLPNVDLLRCEYTQCKVTDAGRACGWFDTTALNCPSGYQP